MQWDNTYSIGIDEIDNQHKLLIDYITLLQDAIACGGRWSDVHFPLIQLREFAEMHFRIEESLMSMSDYPDTANHLEAHREILRRLAGLERSSLEKMNVAADEALFLREWLFGHIMKADRDYARHFANGGKIIVRSDTR